MQDNKHLPAYPVKQSLFEGQRDYCKQFSDNLQYGLLRDKAFEAGAKWKEEQFSIKNDSPISSQRTLIAARCLQGMLSNTHAWEELTIEKMVVHSIECADILLTHLSNTDT